MTCSSWIDGEAAVGTARAWGLHRLSRGSERFEGRRLLRLVRWGNLGWPDIGALRDELQNIGEVPEIALLPTLYVVDLPTPIRGLFIALLKP